MPSEMYKVIQNVLLVYLEEIRGEGGVRGFLPHPEFQVQAVTLIWPVEDVVLSPVPVTPVTLLALLVWEDPEPLW